MKLTINITIDASCGDVLDFVKKLNPKRPTATAFVEEKPKIGFSYEGEVR